MAAPMEVIISSDASGQMWNSSVWDLQSGTSVVTYKGGCTSPHGLCLLSNQYLLGSVSSKPLIHVWALQRRDQQQMKIVCPGRVTALALSPDGAYCVAAVGEKIHIWQVCTGNLMVILSRHYQDVNVIKFTDNGSHCISGGEDNLILIWSLASVLTMVGDRTKKPEPEKILTSHSLPVTDLYVGRGGNCARVVSSSLDQTCKIWDICSGEVLCTFVFPVSILSVSMDTAEFRMFAGSSSGDIYTVNMYGEPIRTERYIEPENKGVTCYKGHSRQVTCLSVSMDGCRLVSGSHDCSVRIWDVFSGQCTNTLSHKGAVTNVMIVPTPPAIVNPHLKPTIPIQQFKRHLYIPGADNPDEDLETWDVRIETNVEAGESDLKHLLRQMESQTINTETEDEFGRLQMDVHHLKSMNKDLYNCAVNQILCNSNKIS